ncbi:helix-turn-helix domain-containing protein [Burkholderia arboris]|uniref:Helix-turn-helix domain-containing protein n=1 Tax=Burkholderia metallica TaxID=488729 RepID=A0ABT8PJ34_9BURK|nr:helix-turn-helix domain-containing protein [Burkholderia metallica]MCA8031986.1 helix-turn-helix domain-containing protein [Burkholderia arboris]MDN7935156.1 helix-turn-helix domain-containing protein [Burkholderia metallica]
MSVGARLKEERKRLGMNQTEFAELGGVTRKAQSDYENDLFSPNTRYLAAVATVGVDVLYVVTGQRTPGAVETLSKDEEALLDNYRHSAPEDQAVVRRTATALAEPTKRKSRNGSTG